MGLSAFLSTQVIDTTSVGRSLMTAADAAAARSAIGAGTSSFDGAFGSLTGVPTTISGYGITNAYTKTEVDNLVAGLLDFKGNQDCSANPNYPSASKGDAYYCSVAGKIGGASGVTVAVGDLIVCAADNAGGTQASVGSSWFVLEKNLDGALVSSNNLSDLTSASTARTNLGLGTLATQSGTFSGTSSGTNTGDQTITLTGDVTGSGTGSFATAIANSAVTNAMLAGSIAISKLSITGTPDGTKFLRDDGSWAAASGGSGITSLGGQTGATQTFQTGTSGTDFAISSASNIHTFNIPDASASARGLVTTGAQTFAGQKTFAQGTLTSSAPLTLTQTWNNAAVSFVGISIDITKTAAQLASPIFRVRQGATSLFEMRADDGLFTCGAITVTDQGYGRYSFRTDGINAFRADACGVGITNGVNGISLGSSRAISWSSTTNWYDTADIFLYRDAAATLALRNSTNAQTFRVYNTYTSSTSHEYLKFAWATNVAEIGTVKGSGGGSARDLVIKTDDTERLRFASTGLITVADAHNLATGTTTGTKIGTATTQKIGFWNATPIVQPTTGVASATITGGGGTALTDTDTYDGYTIAQVVKALRNMGALA